MIDDAEHELAQSEERADERSVAVLPRRGSPTHKRIAAWLAGELRQQGLREIARVELFVSPATGRPGARGEQIREWARSDTPELFGMSGVHALTSEIVSYAENDAVTPGSHRYTIRCVNKIDTYARMSFIVEGPEVESADGVEDPTVHGLVAQQMRHNELLMRANLQISSATSQTLAAQLELANERILTLEKQRLEYLTEREKLLSEENERDLRAMAQVSSDKRKDQAFEKIVTLLPAVVNRIAGQQLIPQSSSPREQMLGEIMRRLQSDPDLTRRLIAVLPPEITILLVELMRSSAQTADGGPNGAPVNGAEHGARS